jgi:hypothetical protein
MFMTTEGKNPLTSAPRLIMPISRFSPSSFSRELVLRRSLSRSRRSSSIYGVLSLLFVWVGWLG